MVPHWPLRATLQPLFAACTGLLKTLDLGRWETPDNPVLMLTTQPLCRQLGLCIFSTRSKENWAGSTSRSWLQVRVTWNF